MKSFVSLIFVVFCVVLSQQVLAQVAPVEGLDWLTSVINFVSEMPYIGPVLVVIFKVASVASIALTALAAFLEVILTIPELVAKFSGATEFAAKVNKIKNKILPWIKYISMFNVQKKK